MATREKPSSSRNAFWGNENIHYISHTQGNKTGAIIGKKVSVDNKGFEDIDEFWNSAVNPNDIGSDSMPSDSFLNETPAPSPIPKSTFQSSPFNAERGASMIMEEESMHESPKVEKTPIPIRTPKKIEPMRQTKFDYESRMAMDSMRTPEKTPVINRINENNIKTPSFLNSFANRSSEITALPVVKTPFYKPNLPVPPKPETPKVQKAEAGTETDAEIPKKVGSPVLGKNPLSASESPLYPKPIIKPTKPIKRGQARQKSPSSSESEMSSPERSILKRNTRFSAKNSFNKNHFNDIKPSYKKHNDSFNEFTFEQSPVKAPTTFAGEKKEPTGNMFKAFTEFSREKPKRVQSHFIEEQDNEDSLLSSFIKPRAERKTTKTNFDEPVILDSEIKPPTQFLQSVKKASDTLGKTKKKTSGFGSMLMPQSTRQNDFPSSSSSSSSDDENGSIGGFKPMFGKGTKQAKRVDNKRSKVEEEQKDEEEQEEEIVVPKRFAKKNQKQSNFEEEEDQERPRKPLSRFTKKRVIAEDEADDESNYVEPPKRFIRKEKEDEDEEAQSPEIITNDDMEPQIVSDSPESFTTKVQPRRNQKQGTERSSFFDVVTSPIKPVRQYTTPTKSRLPLRKVNLESPEKDEEEEEKKKLEEQKKIEEEEKRKQEEEEAKKKQAEEELKRKQEEEELKRKQEEEKRKQEEEEAKKKQEEELKRKQEEEEKRKQEEELKRKQQEEEERRKKEEEEEKKKLEEEEIKRKIIEERIRKKIIEEEETRRKNEQAKTFVSSKMFNFESPGESILKNSRQDAQNETKTEEAKPKSSFFDVDKENKDGGFFENDDAPVDVPAEDTDEVEDAESIVEEKKQSAIDGNSFFASPKKPSTNASSSSSTRGSPTKYSPRKHRKPTTTLELSDDDDEAVTPPINDPIDTEEIKKELSKKQLPKTPEGKYVHKELSPNPSPETPFTKQVNSELDSIKLHEQIRESPRPRAAYSSLRKTNISLTSLSDDSDESDNEVNAPSAPSESSEESPKHPIKVPTDPIKDPNLKIVFAGDSSSSDNHEEPPKQEEPNDVPDIDDAPINIPSDTEEVQQAEENMTSKTKFSFSSDSDSPSISITGDIQDDDDRVMPIPKPKEPEPEPKQEQEPKADAQQKIERLPQQISPQQSPEVPVKRKRGRPRKNPLANGEEQRKAPLKKKGFEQAYVPQFGAGYGTVYDYGTKFSSLSLPKNKLVENVSIKPGKEYKFQPKTLETIVIVGKGSGKVICENDFDKNGEKKVFTVTSGGHSSHLRSHFYTIQNTDEEEELIIHLIAV